MTDKRQKRIFVVDDNNTNLTACKKILKSQYEVYPVPSAAKMFELLDNVIPDLILLDVDMPDMNGYEAAGRLKKNETFKEIPIMFLSGRVDPTSEMFGLSMGALDYIHKPYVGDLLLKRLETHLTLIDSKKILEERNRSIKEVFKMTLEIHIPLNAITEMLKTAMDTGDYGKIGECLKMADAASKQLLALFNDIEIIDNQ